MPRGIYQVLELVRERPYRHGFYEISGAHVLIHDSGGVGDQKVEHLREVTRRAALNGSARRGWKEIPAEEEAANVEILARRRELIDGSREEEDHALVFVDVGWITEVERVNRVHERIERSPEILEVRCREPVSGVGRVAHYYRAVRDCDDAPGPDIGIRTSRRGVSVEIHQIADLRNGDR